MRSKPFNTFKRDALGSPAFPLMLRAAFASRLFGPGAPTFSLAAGESDGELEVTIDAAPESWGDAETRNDGAGTPGKYEWFHPSTGWQFLENAEEEPAEAPPVDGVAIYTLNAPGPTQSNVPLGADEPGRRIWVCTAIAGGAPSAVSLGGQAMTLEYSANLATNRDVRVWSGTPSGTTGDLTITTGNTNAERYAVFRTVGLEGSDPDVASTDIENLSDETQCTTSVEIPAAGGAVLMFARRYLTISGDDVTQDPAAASADFSAAYAATAGAATINATYDRTGQGSVNGKIAGAYLLTRSVG